MIQRKGGWRRLGHAIGGLGGVLRGLIFGPACGATERLAGGARRAPAGGQKSLKYGITPILTPLIGRAPRRAAHTAAASYNIQ